jgi:hypothetical protein
MSESVFAVRGRRLPGVFLPSFVIWTLLATIIAFWILRNLPWYPFSLLAPGGL